MHNHPPNLQSPFSINLSRLLPRAVETNQRTGGSGNTDNSVIESSPSQTRGWHDQVAAVGEQLELDRSTFANTNNQYKISQIRRTGNSPLDLLSLNHALAILLIQSRLSILQRPQRIQTANNAEAQPSEPRLLRIPSNSLRIRGRPDASSIQERSRIKRQVRTVPELASDRGILEHRVEILAVGCDLGALEVLDVLAEAHGLARESELLLDSLEGLDGRGGGIGAVQVPRVEAREVLDGAEELVAADGCGDEAEVVRERGVVDDGVDDGHGWKLWKGYWMGGWVFGRRW
jgi:hypothetical protein